MNKPIPLIVIHRLFTAAALLVVGAFFGFLAYMYVAFNEALIGDIHNDIPPELLSRLDDKKLQAAIGSLETRANLPDIPSDLPDPYSATRPLPPPGTPQPPPPPGAPPRP